MNNKFSKQNRLIGCLAAWMGFILLQLYSIFSLLGVLSIKTDGDAIGSPYLQIMAVLLILISTMLLVSMVIVIEYSTISVKVYANISMVLIIIMTAISSSVNYSILVASSLEHLDKPIWLSLIIPYKWPSLAYALDIFAWDWFYGIAMIIGSAVFRTTKEEQLLRIAMIISGSLSVIGLFFLLVNIDLAIGISIIGWGVAGSIVSLLLAIVFGRSQPEAL